MQISILFLFKQADEFAKPIKNLLKKKITNKRKIKWKKMEEK